MGSMNCGCRRAVSAILPKTFVGIIAQREFGFDACRKRHRAEISSSGKVETFSRSRKDERVLKDCLLVDDGIGCVELFDSAAAVDGGGGGGADGNADVWVDIRDVVESLYIFFRSPMLLAPTLRTVSGFTFLAVHTDSLTLRSSLSLYFS